MTTTILASAITSLAVMLVITLLCMPSLKGDILRERAVEDKVSWLVREIHKKADFDTVNEMLKMHLKKVFGEKVLKEAQTKAEQDDLKKAIQVLVKYVNSKEAEK